METVNNMRIILTKNKSGKWDGDRSIDMKYQRFGYNWFFYLPYIVWNGGYWKHVVTDWSIKLGPYSVGFLIWWR